MLFCGRGVVIGDLERIFPIRAEVNEVSEVGGVPFSMAALAFDTRRNGHCQRREGEALIGVGVDEDAASVLAGDQCKLGFDLVHGDECGRTEDNCQQFLLRTASGLSTYKTGGSALVKAVKEVKSARIVARTEEPTRQQKQRTDGDNGGNDVKEKGHAMSFLTGRR